MTTITESRRTERSFTPAQGVTLPELVRQTLNLLRERRDQAKARARLRWELSQYSDRGLADMGLSRADIDDVVHGRYAL